MRDWWDWREYAACQGMDLELFFAAHWETTTHPAQTICDACPVLHQCRTDAVQHSGYGFSGGLTAEQRRTIRTEQGIPEPRLRIRINPRTRNR